MADRPAAPRARQVTLTGVVWPFVLGMVIMLGFGWFSINTLAALRSYSQGENLWIKNHKSATLQLLRYAYTADPEALATFDQTRPFSRAFSNARRGLSSDPINAANVLEAGRALGYTDGEIGQVIWLRRHFGRSEFVSGLFDIWKRADLLSGSLESLRTELEMRTRTDVPSMIDRAELTERILDIDRASGPLAHAFTGQLATMSRTVTAILWAAGGVLGLLMTLAIVLRTWQMLQSRQHIEATLLDERQHAAVILSAIAEAVVSTGPSGEVLSMNPAAERLFQHASAPPSGPDDERDEPALASVVELIDGDTGESQIPAIVRLPDGNRRELHGAGNPLVVRPDGTRVPVQWVASVIRTGPDAGVALVLHDATRERQLIERLGWLASHDSLTALPNRRDFERRLGALMSGRDLAAAARVADGGGSTADTPAVPSAAVPPSGAPEVGPADALPALLLVDLDQFRIVNDTCGHAAGDELLRRVGNALHACVTADDVLARMGGDEFGLLIRATPRASVVQRAEAFRRAVAGVTLEWGMRSFTTTVSIGLVDLARVEGDVAEALSAADVACYLAKEKGRNRIEVYSPGNREQASRLHEMAWTERLQAAVREGRLELFEQPLLALDALRGLPARSELLLRLRDERGNIVTPGDFMPAAERFGLMPMIDRWVVDCALRGIGHRLRAGIAQRTVYCINLCGTTLGERGFADDVNALFRAHQVPHDRVCFEITESQAVANLQAAADLMQQLRALGCQFALDDFGVGMSSFTYVKSLPVDVLKIDGGFVRNMTGDAIDRTIVEMTQALARTMGLVSVGESAESRQTIDALRACGVDYAQGIAVAMPRPFMTMVGDRQTA